MERNKTVMYGMIAAAHIAQNCDEGFVRAETVAKEYSIPLAYGQVIMRQLCVAHVLRSNRASWPGKEMEGIDISR